MYTQIEDTPAVIAKMKALRSSFSNAELNVVDYIIENPNQIVNLSVADLADCTNVSDATVVRTCQRLGFSGYYELKLTLAQNIAVPLQSGKVKPEDNASTIMDKIFMNTICTLKFTHSTANIVEDIERAAHCIKEAGRVFVFAFGNASAIAQDFQHKLMRLGIKGMALSDPHMQIIAASQLEQSDVVFAISHSGSSRDIIESVRVAKKQSARIITLSNIGNSPLSREADIHLHTASEETTYHIPAQASRIAQLVIIDTICSIISVSDINANDREFHILEALKIKKY